MNSKDEKKELFSEGTPEEEGRNVKSENGTTELSSENSTEEIDEIQALREKIATLEDLKLRMAAENQNTRKRLVKQQQDAHKYRHQDLLRDLLDVIDNFQRAIDSSVESRDFEVFHEGIKMIEKQFISLLTERYHLQSIGEEGEPFDPAAHEAMMMEESADAEQETVKQVFQAGYRLHDRVLRPAKVIVVKPENNISDRDVDAESEKQ